MSEAKVILLFWQKLIFSNTWLILAVVITSLHCQILLSSPAPFRVVWSGPV